MNIKYIKRILKLQKRSMMNEEKKWYFFSHHDLLDWIFWELEEVKVEIKQNNKVYLEDELADVFWCYIRLLYSLDQDKYIDIEKVFERAEEKFWERTEAVENDITWDEIKKIQKEKRESEHNTLYQK